MSDHANLMRLLSGEAFRGIGKITARRVVDAFGIELYAILDGGDAKPFSDLLSEAKTQALLRGWKIASDQKAIARWLDEHGINDTAISAIVYRVWGRHALDKLTQNPYRLLAFTNWRIVDKLAADLGVAADHPVRLVGAAEAMIYVWLDEQGSTWVDAATLERDIARLLASRGSMLSYDQLARDAIAKALETRALIEVGDGCQAPGAYYAERQIESWIHHRLSDRPEAEAAKDALSGIERRQRTHFTVEQRVAIQNALQNRLSIFHGGAGVGKTFVVRGICELAEQGGKRPVLLALAAKAVRKLAGSTGREAMTLARALYRLKPKDLEHTVVVIDEFSMVDMLDFRRLIRRLPENAHLVLCGDAAQLPSIGPGRLLYSFICSGAMPSQELTITHRQAAETGVPTKLRAVRDGQLPDLPEFDWDAPYADGLFSLNCKGMDYRAIQRLVTRLLDAYEGEAQVISPLARYPLGCHALNAYIHRHLTGDRAYTVGAPVVFTGNKGLESGDEIVNGLQGRVRSVLNAQPKYGDDVHLEVATDDGIVILRLSESEAWLELAYALTVHRAQGSDWDTVIAVLPVSQLLERAMVYTALSRCKRRSIVLAPDPAALETAVMRAPSYRQRQDRLFATAKKLDTQCGAAASSLANVHPVE